MLAGTCPVNPELERFRCVSLMRRTNPSEGIFDPPKDVTARPLLAPAPAAQPTPSQPQQSVPARHDRKAVTELLVTANERFSRSNAAAWSGRHGTPAGVTALLAELRRSRNESCRRSSRRRGTDGV
uniref:Uncharacterized protein n=1 Tax=Oryza rufipogon TaxID=4529 RepID=A0A0E0MRN3_ORYRU